MDDRDWHYELTRDPRAATYPEDSHHWVWLKECVFEDSQASDDLLGGLDYLRCHGARIIASVNCGYRLGRGDCPGEVYEAVRSTVLTEHAVLLKRLLRSMPPNPLVSARSDRIAS
jgi:hypothetical protein